MSSVAQRVVERHEAELSETDDDGRLQVLNKVAVVAVVGNEDGAHKISGDLFHTTDYQDLEQTPDAVASTTSSQAGQSAHLARALTSAGYPATS